MTGKTDVFENDILKLVFNGAAIGIEGKRTMFVHCAEQSQYIERGTK